MGHKHSNKNKSKKKQDSLQTHIGRLDITRSGMGFVMIDGIEQDVLVRPNDFNTALHGDKVRVKLVNSSSSKSGRMQGEITEVLERKQTQFPGHIELSDSFAFFVPETDKPMPDVFIPLNQLKEAKDKSRVIVKIVEWEKNRKPRGEVVEVMDNESLNDQAMKRGDEKNIETT